MNRHAQLSDNELAQQLAEGSQAALGELVRRWHGPLRLFAESVCARGDLADEVCQDIWIRIYRYRKRLSMVSDVSAYLFATAHNCCRSAIGERMRRSRLPSIPMDGGDKSPDPPDGDPLPLDRLLDRERVVLLRAAIALLPRMQRAVVTMYLHGTTDFESIAAALGIRQATARSHMHRALQALRHTLGLLAIRSEIPIQTLRREVSS